MDTNEVRSTDGHDGRPDRDRGPTLAAYDVVVVGGGAAGLAGALALARARRSVLVIDAGTPRNAPAGHVHNYLGREGTPPLELLEIGRTEVAGYGGEIVSDRVASITPLGDGTFVVDRADGPPVAARRVLVTTGLVDELPDIAGIVERFGRDVLHCPYCHGWEVRDQAIAIIGTPMFMHLAVLWRQWTAALTLVLPPDITPTDEDARRLVALGIVVVVGDAAALEVADDRVTGVRLADDRVVPCEAVVVAPRFVARSELFDGLGLVASDLLVGHHPVGTYIPADPVTGATAVPGVHVAGNVTSPMDQVIAAAASGLRVAAFLNMDLAMADADAAVAGMAGDQAGALGDLGGSSSEPTAAASAASR